jgi:transcriptional regulator GlxA family with amidase domain
LDASLTPETVCVGAIGEIASRYRDPLTLGDVAGSIGCSPRTVQRALAARHTSFDEELARVRLEAAAELLAGQAISVEMIARLVGYRGGSSLSAAFRRRFALSPAQYRAAARADRRQTQGLPDAARSM